MSFSSSIFSAGGYNAAINSVAVGLMRGAEQSPTCEIMRHGQLIENTHLYGRTPIGQVGLGGSAFCNIIVMEPQATGLMAVLWPYTTQGKMPTVGVDDFDLAVAMTLTVAGTTLASANNPDLITMHKVMIAEDFAMRVTYGPILREIPWRARLYPNDSTNLLFWTLA